MSDTPVIQNATATIHQLPLPKRDRRRAEDRWSPQVMKLGFTLLPKLLLRAQGRLKISPTQMNVLLHLAEHWWEADRSPYPSKELIAKRMGKSPRQIQRYLTELEKAGLIRRRARYSGKKAQISNAYDLDGLIAKLQALAPEFVKAAAQNRVRSRKLEVAS
jgi:DNA-binding transcriptional ArsR family regulator